MIGLPYFASPVCTDRVWYRWLDRNCLRRYIRKQAGAARPSAGRHQKRRIESPPESLGRAINAARLARTASDQAHHDRTSSAAVHTVALAISASHAADSSKTNHRLRNQPDLPGAEQTTNTRSRRAQTPSSSRSWRNQIKPHSCANPRRTPCRLSSNTATQISHAACDDRVLSLGRAWPSALSRSPVPRRSLAARWRADRHSCWPDFLASRIWRSPAPHGEIWPATLTVVPTV